MKSSPKIFKIIITLIMALLITSCGNHNTLLEPSKLISRDILPVYLGYILKDESISFERKKAIKMQIKSYNKLLNMYKKEGGK